MTRCSRLLRPLLAPLGLMMLCADGSAQEAHRIEIVPNVPHSSAITSLTFSRDGSRLLSGSRDKSVKLWETATGRLLRTFVGHSDYVTSVAFSPDGTRLLSGGYIDDKTVKLWDAASGKLIRTWEAHGSGVEAVAFSPDGTHLLSAGSEYVAAHRATVGRLKLWDAASGQLIRIFEGHSNSVTRPVTSAAFSPDGKTLLSGSGDKTLKLWDIANGQVIHTFAGHANEVTSVAFSPDGMRVLSGSQDQTLKLWDVVSGQLVRTFERPDNWVRSVAFSPDGTRLVSASPGGFRLWDASSGRLMRSFGGHSLPVEAVAFSSDGAHLVSAGGTTLKLWDAVSGQPIPRFEGYSRSVQSVAYSSDGTRLLSGSADHTLKLWDAAGGQLIRTFAGHKGWVRSVAFSSDATRALSGSDDKTLRLWDVASGQRVQTFEGHSRLVASVAISPDGAHLLSGSSDNTVKLWDAASGRLIRTLEGHTGWVESVAFSPDGIRLISGSSDKTLKLWDATNGQLIRTVSGHQTDVKAVAISPDGARVLAGGAHATPRGVIPKSLTLWDAESGQPLRTFEGHAEPINAVAFSSDGTRLVSGSWDTTVKLWDAASAKLIRTFEGHAGWVSSVALSPAGKHLLSGSRDGTVRIWNAATGQHLVSLLASQHGEWLAITPEGFFDASAKGVDMLSIVRGLETYGVDQFYQALYRPDLVREKLVGDPDGQVKAAAAKLDLAKLLDSGRVPSIVITSHVANDSSQVDLVTVEARLADQGGGIGRAEWRINGLTVGVVEKAAGATGQPVTMKQAMALDPGENVVELTAYNGSDLVASVPARTKITWTGTQPTVPPRLHVLVVGINDYLDATLKLTYAVPDAKSLAVALKEAGKGHYEDVIVTPIFDRDANAAKLDQVFTDLAARVRPRDVFVFFAAGHGKTLDGRYYFIPHDLRYHTDQSLVRDAIGQDKLQAWFARIQAKKAVLMFDTCEAGSLTERSKTRGGLEQKAALGRLIQATGRATLTASTATQEAYEGHGGHGVFTFALLDALAHGDTNNNGLVELAELIQHVDGLVPAIAEKRWGAKQFPQMDAYGSNFPLARQVPALAPGETSIIPIRPTHVSAELLQVFKEAGGSGGIVRQLPPFTTVTLVKSDRGWVLIARDGEALGYVAETKLHKLN
jgi:WD40 repeat protein